jgi:hypothetical protein
VKLESSNAAEVGVDDHTATAAVAARSRDRKEFGFMMGWFG